MWNTTLTKSRDNNIFSTWEWVSCWWKHFGEGRKLRVLIAEDENKTLAIAPLMWSKYSLLHLGSLTKIEFIGSSQSDYNNFIFIEREMMCLKSFLEYLIDRHSDWDCLELTDVSENSSSIDLLRKIPAGESLNGELEERFTTLCPYMDLPDSTETFMKGLSGNMRRNLRRRMRKLNEHYRTEVKTHKDFNTVEKAMNAFFELHQKRWRTQGKSGVFDEKRLRGFHLDVARKFAERGWLSLHFLIANDEPIAAIYSFDHKNKKYEYLTGFDPEYYQYGVGNLIRMRAVEECIQKGLTEYDLMRGYEPYKHDWNTKSRKNLELRLVRKGLLARIHNWALKSDTALLLAQKIGKLLALKA